LSSGLNRDLLAPFVGAPRADHPVLVSVGTLEPVKNHETVLRAANILHEKHPNLEVVIVGDGPRRAQLEGLANGCNVRITGHLPREKVYAEVTRAWVFALASRRLASKREGVPTALLEAMALRRPCVVSSACGPESIAPADTGSYLVADPDDPADFAATIGKVIDDQHLAAMLGVRAESAVAHLGWDDIVDRVEDVYRKALERA
jgi:glycosyltransferase involved in cell wall biosynthesis